ncbi:MAG TPA: hypothetical protein VES93_04330 [Ornithinibacter sp.]|nr:hypothetical protein [Ornithinibacter sp.]
MGTTTTRRVVAVALTATAAGVLVAAPAAAAVSGRFTTGTNIRRCPQLSCVKDGIGYPSHSVTVYCYTYGSTADGTNIWYKVKDTTTGVSGYSLSRYVDYNGVLYRC